MVFLPTYTLNACLVGRYAQTTNNIANLAEPYAAQFCKLKPITCAAVVTDKTTLLVVIIPPESVFTPT
jgi:hypothetical protein